MWLHLRPHALRGVSNMRTELAPDAILVLPAGRELDAIVAEKVMGMRVLRHADGSISEGGQGNERVRRDAKIPMYSTSIAAAWEVVEKLLSGGRSIVMTCGIDSLPTFFVRIGDDPGEFVAENTAPLAICRAALKAVMG